MVGLAFVLAFTQAPRGPLSAIVPAQEFRNVDIRVALRKVLGEANVGYAFEPRVSGTTTVNLPRQSLREDLEKILDPFKFKFTETDSTIAISWIGDQERKGQSESFEFKNADARVALTQLFRSLDAHALIAIPTIVTGKVSYGPGASNRFNFALTSILDQVDAIYRIDGRIFKVVPRNVRAYRYPLNMDLALDARMPSIDMEGVNIDDALRYIFDWNHTAYSVEAFGTGKVSVHMRDASFELVLQNVLNMVDWTYRVEKGAFVIVSRDDGFETSNSQERAMLQSPFQQVVSGFEFQDTDLREALSSVLSSVGVPYIIGPGVDGTVTLRSDIFRLGTLLQLLCSANNLSYRMVDDIVVIEANEPRT